MKQFFKSYRATFILLGAILLGAVGGLLFGERAVAVKPLGDIFLNVMLAIIVPLIFVTIETAGENHGGNRRRDCCDVPGGCGGGHLCNPAH